MHYIPVLVVKCCIAVSLTSPCLQPLLRFSFPNLPRPIGAFAGTDFIFFNPQQRKEREFDGNSAHSAGTYWIDGTCMYVGGKLVVENGLLR